MITWRSVTYLQVEKHVLSNDSVIGSLEMRALERTHWLTNVTGDILYMI